jgi:enoyl-CoA hydratase/carnithine racemase
LNNGFQDSDANVIVEKQAGIATIIINRPEKRNALSLSVVDNLLEAWRDIERDPAVRVVVLSGAGNRAFAAGADLDELPSAFSSPDSARDYDARFGQLYDAITESRVPVIARMAGHAIGGGCLLAMACDLRIAAEEIRIGFPVARIGLFLSPHEHRLLLSHLPISKAKLLIFSARKITAQQALEWNLLDMVVPASQLDATVLALAQDIAAGAPLAIGCAKSMLNALDAQSNVQQAISNAYETIYRSADLAEGLAAIGAGRTPEFTGK